jgi:hypothetical protein
MIYNFNTATHSMLKNLLVGFFDMVPQPPQPSTVSSVTIVGNRT